MQKWEYRVVTRMGDIKLAKTAMVASVNGEYVQAKDKQYFYQYLEQLGKDGWELVSTEVDVYYFKRPLE